MSARPLTRAQHLGGNEHSYDGKRTKLTANYTFEGVGIDAPGPAQSGHCRGCDLQRKSLHSHTRNVKVARAFDKKNGVQPRVSCGAGWDRRILVATFLAAMRAGGISWSFCRIASWGSALSTRHTTQQLDRGRRRESRGLLSWDMFQFSPK